MTLIINLGIITKHFTIRSKCLIIVTKRGVLDRVKFVGNNLCKYTKYSY